ncbi:MAG: glycosyltransferase family 2 protein [Candidatus Buchananbacteria bacterium]|nr:glycosyltransferase family 2 protein [Candidatus Buchananbacteria bacterium]
MELSIIITNYKTRGLLKQCLKGIYLFPPTVEYEVIVVDNNSQDGSVELVQENFPQVKLIELKENAGFHRGNNAGIKAATGKYLIFLNTDIAIFDNAFDKMHQFMETHPEAALMGPKLQNPDGSIQASCLRFPTLLVPFYRRTLLGMFGWAQRATNHYLMTDFDHTTTRTVDWILGACMIVRRSAVDVVGMMDERLFLYFGDVAWCRKFHDTGYQVYYFADTHIIHYHQRESAQSGITSKVFWIHIRDWLTYLKYYQLHV